MNIDQVLGTGLVNPLRRQGGDYAYASGSDLVESAVRQILMTKKGDLRWRPSFGLRLDRLRHRKIDPGLLASVQSDIVTALSVDPRIEVLNIETKQSLEQQSAVIARVTWRAVQQGSNRSTVLTGDRQTEVRI